MEIGANTCIDRGALQDTVIEYGVKLDVTPKILGNGSIETQIAPEVSDLDYQNGVSLNGARSLDDVEKDHILRVLDDCGGNQTRAAEVLGIDRVTLHHKLKKYGWSRKEKELVGAES